MVLRGDTGFRNLVSHLDTAGDFKFQALMYCIYILYIFVERLMFFLFRFLVKLELITRFVCLTFRLYFHLKMIMWIPHNYRYSIVLHVYMPIMMLYTVLSSTGMLLAICLHVHTVHTCMYSMSSYKIVVLNPFPFRGSSLKSKIVWC